MLPYLVFCQTVKPWVIFNLNTASSNNIKRQVERPQSWYISACNWFPVFPSDYMKTHSKMVLLSGSVTRDEFALIPSVWNDKKTWFDMIFGSPNCARSCRTIKFHSKGFCKQFRLSTNSFHRVERPLLYTKSSMQRRGVDNSKVNAVNSMNMLFEI